MYPASEQVSAVGMQDDDGMNALHCAAHSGNFETIQYLFNLYPESQLLQVVSSKVRNGDTVLHHAPMSSCDKILSLLPEAQRLPAMMMEDSQGWTVFQCAAALHETGVVLNILKLLPESQRQQLVYTLNGRGKEVHSIVTPHHNERKQFIRECIMELLPKGTQMDDEDWILLW